jgi:microcystin-dependent protein
MDPLVGEIRLFSFNFAPAGWVACNGQLMPIAQYQMLYSLLGNTYGGDGVSTFALPNFQGRAPVHIGPGAQMGGMAGGEPVSQGSGPGATTPTLTVNFCIAIMGNFPQRA